jgi:hypothetical protein
MEGTAQERWEAFECDGRELECAADGSVMRVRNPGSACEVGEYFPEGTQLTRERAVETARLHWPEMTRETEASPLERAVVEESLVGDHPDLVVLRAQWATAVVRARSFSGQGWFVTFSVAANAKRTSFEKLVFGNVTIEPEPGVLGCGAVVWVNDGRLDCLEMFAYGDGWPRAMSRFTLRREVTLPTFERSLAEAEARGHE